MMTCFAVCAAIRPKRFVSTSISTWSPTERRFDISAALSTEISSEGRLLFNNSLPDIHTDYFVFKIRLHKNIIDRLGSILL